MINIKLYNNLETLLTNSNPKKIIKRNNNILKMLTFTTMPTFVKKVSNRLPFANLLTGVSTKKNNYIFKHNKKKYPFNILSEENIQKIDKKNLTSDEIAYKNDLIRVLKLACSMDLVNTKIIIYNSEFKSIGYLISFEENSIEKIIDYAKNIIMNKKDYLELFPINEINTLTKDELYRIYIFLKETEEFQLLYYLLIFSKEILNDLSKHEMFKEISTNDDFGFSDINKKNASILGRYCDYLYFEDSDNESKYSEERQELDKFALNPKQESTHIAYNNKTNKYTFKNESFGSFEFSLLSDSIDYEPIKKDLLSSNRYHKCHQNSHNVMAALEKEDKDNALLVAGKIKINEIDYVYHSWVEIENKNVVIDYNHNLIMNRDKYYKLYEAIPIQKTSKENLSKIIELAVGEAALELSYLIINYFGQEIYDDLLRNKKIFTKK
ncbi:MAG: hypothetical protein HFE81_03325 [Bacilli bacterium]|nr:hypothetical protein [Bacilli bacterium]